MSTNGESREARLKQIICNLRAGVETIHASMGMSRRGMADFAASFMQPAIRQLEGLLYDPVLRESPAAEGTPAPTVSAGHEAAPVAINHEDAAEIYVPGAWRCLQCAFGLQKATLFVASGTIGSTLDDITRMTGEVCPNDGTAMVRVTWRDRARENQEWAERLMNDVLAASGMDTLPSALKRIQELAAPVASEPREDVEARINKMVEEEVAAFHRSAERLVRNIFGSSPAPVSPVEPEPLAAEMLAVDWASWVCARCCWTVPPSVRGEAACRALIRAHINQHVADVAGPLVEPTPEPPCRICGDDCQCQTPPVEPEPCVWRLKEAATWVLNVMHGCGRAGGEPEPGEHEAALESLREALAAPLLVEPKE